MIREKFYGKKVQFSGIIPWFLESMVKLVQSNFSLIINRAYVPVVIRFQRENNPVCQSVLSILCISVSVFQYMSRERETESVTETQTWSERVGRSERVTDRQREEENERGDRDTGSVFF